MSITVTEFFAALPPARCTQCGQDVSRDSEDGMHEACRAAFIECLTSKAEGQTTFYVLHHHPERTA